jgi:hypothetical protein
MSASQKHISTQQFTSTEKRELIEYLCRDCPPISDGDALSGPSQDGDMACGEYLGHGQYVDYVSRFVDLLNKEDPNYRIARITVRRLWQNNGLPKCQMADLCRYVLLGLEIDRIPEYEKTYSDYLSDTGKQIDSMLKVHRGLKYLLLQEQDFVEKKFEFSFHNDELNTIIELAESCLDAASEVREIRRTNFSVLTRRHDLFALRAMACHLMLAHPHGARGSAELKEISDILPILHEAIDDRVPDVSRYDRANLKDEATRFKEDHVQKRLQEIEQNILQISPRSLDMSNKSWQYAPRTPRGVPVSTHYSVTLTLANFLRDFRKYPYKEDFADTLEERLRLFVGLTALSRSRHP